MIRPFREEDLPALARVTEEVFGPSSIDYHVQSMFGVVKGLDWSRRKVRDIEKDVRTNPDGVFVWEDAGEVLGYVTTTIDREGGMGRIPNLAVARAAQGRGIGRRLVEHALDYFVREGMETAKIETLVGNAAGEHLYPSLGFREVVRQIHYVRRIGDAPAPAEDEPGDRSR